MNIDEKFWKHRRVFVTGGTGFIGSHLVSKLRSLNAIVKQFVHEAVPADRGTIGVCGDLVNPTPELKRFLESFKPQIVFHLAAQPIVNLALDDHLQTLKVNIDGTYNLLSTCYHLRWLENFVYISTDKVYGNTDIITKDSIAYSVTHPYNTSKLSADLLAQMYCNTFETPVTILRHGNIYGSGDQHWDRIIPNNVNRVLNGKSPEVRGDGQSLRDYIYVDEVVIGYLNAAQFGMKSTSPVILNLGASKPYRVIDVVDIILKTANRIDLAPEYVALGKGEIPNQHFDDDTAKEKIGWNPKIELEEGIAKLFPWYVEHIRNRKDEPIN